jgi:hypothetical protein
VDSTVQVFDHAAEVAVVADTSAGFAAVALALADGSHRLMVRSTDSAGNFEESEEVRFTVDTTPPSFDDFTGDVPDVTLELGDSTDPANTGTPASTDASVDTLPFGNGQPLDPTPTVTFSDSSVFTVVDLGAGNGCTREVITRTWTTTDDCGNSFSQDQIITINDSTAPTVSCPSTLDLVAGEIDGASVLTLPDLTGLATADDLAGIGDIVQTPPAGTLIPAPDVVTITLEVFDADNCNSTSCDIELTVVPLDFSGGSSTCSYSPEQDPTGTLPLLLLVLGLLAWRFRVGASRVVVILALVAVLAASAPADAFEGFNSQNFRVPHDPHGYITMNGARTLKQFQPHVAVGANYARDPLVFDETLPGELVTDRTDLDASFGIGLLEFGNGGISLGVHVPLNLQLEGHRFGNVNSELNAGGWGSITASLKVTALDREDDIVGVWGQFAIEFPSGDDQDFAANADHLSLHWNGGVEKQFGKILRVGIEAGYQWIDEDIQLAGLQVDDQLRLSAGAAVSPGGLAGIEALEDLWFMFEATVKSRAGDFWERGRESPVELGGGIKYAGPLYVMLGATAGANEGIGAPEIRLFAQIGFTFPMGDDDDDAAASE